MIQWKGEMLTDLIGDGLRPFLASQAHYQVTIKKGLRTDGMIDSLNVRHPKH